MNNPHRINDAYSDFFNSWFEKHLSASKSAYLVTITFEHEAQRRQRRQAEGLSRGSFEMQAFKHLYLMTCRALIGRNYNRAHNKDRLPHVITFLDADGSKHWRSKGDLTNLHLHSVWLIDETHSPAFEAMMAMNGSNGDALRNLSFDEVDVRPIDTSRKVEMKRVISYASKLTGFTNVDLPLGSDFEVYPLGVPSEDLTEAKASCHPVVETSLHDRKRTTSFHQWLERERQQGV